MVNVCSQCGKPTSLSSGPFHSVRDEIDFINQETSHIDDQIRLLCEQKASLTRRLNQLRSTTRVIPPETLSLIFQHTCCFKKATTLSEYQRQINVLPLIRIGTVCSLWRQIAWSTPAIWSTVIADIRTRNAKSTTFILELCLRNAGTVPLTLDLRFYEQDLLSWGMDPAIIKTIADLVLKHPGNAERIRVLLLQDPPIVWVDHFSERLHNLESLTLAGFTAGVNWTDITFPRLPSLRHLSVSDMWHRITMTSAEGITVLKLSNTCIDSCVGLLRQCMNVEECQFEADQSDRDESEDGQARNIISSSITFPRLRVFTWPFSTGRSNLSLFQHMRLAVLERLRISCPLIRGSIPPPAIEVLKAFFDRSPSTFRILELDQWSCTRENVSLLFPSLPSSTKKLLLADCPETFTTHILRGLNPNLGESKALPLLDNLQAEAISKQGYQLLLQTLENREEGRVTPFRVLLPKPSLRQQDMAKQLEKFVEYKGDQGFQIKLEFFARYR
ncbi:hypothetical protein D9756_002157 [Leucocoprinus leucothites]|uniref:F-box domain-containing protein n=1 Tax=Leucocoprinus leucothites TaxID=201217 RepID=A0A8H5GC25_9AGAR|nr:hypothetical protein D9756_002157 [Leucoagaricus leucothites]